MSKSTFYQDGYRAASFAMPASPPGVPVYADEYMRGYNKFAPDMAAINLQRAANSPLKPSVNQLPADHGLFSDEANQIDLIEMLMEPHP